MKTITIVVNVKDNYEGNGDVEYAEAAIDNAKRIVRRMSLDAGIQWESEVNDWNDSMCGMVKVANE